MKSIMAIIHCITIFILSCFLCTVDAAPNCAIALNVDLSTCIYGVKRDWCNRQVCGKAPGETCGGEYVHLGICGNGLYCLCGQCTGCATDVIKCYYQTQNSANC